MTYFSSGRWPEIEEALILEEQFRANNGRGDPRNPDIIAQKGTRPIIITALHAVVQFRNGKKKLNERYTGTLAIQLLRRTGASVIIGARTPPETPYWNEQDYYGNWLRQFVYDPVLPAKIVLDLHGLSGTVSWDAIIGTGQGKNLVGRHDLVEQIAALFRAANITNFAIDVKGYASVTSQTIASFVARQFQIPALQLEFGAAWRDPETDPQKYSRLLSLLCLEVETIATSL